MNLGCNDFFGQGSEYFKYLEDPLHRAPSTIFKRSKQESRALTNQQPDMTGTERSYQSARQFLAGKFKRSLVDHDPFGKSWALSLSSSKLGNHRGRRLWWSSPTFVEVAQHLPQSAPARSRSLCRRVCDDKARYKKNFDFVNLEFFPRAVSKVLYFVFCSHELGLHALFWATVGGCWQNGAVDAALEEGRL